ncbi:MAG: class I SAM-dependent methyltransferase [Candidatus Bathyarchaeia archaeon]|jgi:SAM-dependent methyltransferase
MSKEANDKPVAVSNKKEECIYGRKWNTVHNGYFSDPKVAYPLINVIKQAIEMNQPNVVVDLGGGTGFILKELLKHQVPSNMRFVNVDVSALQLSECVDDRINYLQASVDQINRNQFQPDENGLMIVARSLLHYFGYSGLIPFLQHIRRQLKEGEIFVHQSACFEKEEDTQCLNLVYKLMSTPKWYTTIGNLKSMLKDAGFSVCNVCPAVKLRLESDELSERYQLSPQQIALISKEVNQRYGQKPELFISSADCFTIWLHYSIFTCKAI